MCWALLLSYMRCWPECQCILVFSLFLYFVQRSIVFRVDANLELSKANNLPINVDVLCCEQSKNVALVVVVVVVIVILFHVCAACGCYMDSSMANYTHIEENAWKKKRRRRRLGNDDGNEKPKWRLKQKKKSSEEMSSYSNETGSLWNIGANTYSGEKLCTMCPAQNTKIVMMNISSNLLYHGTMFGVRCVRHDCSMLSTCKCIYGCLIDAARWNAKKQTEPNFTTNNFNK